MRAGDVVIDQGDVGDRDDAISSGTFEVNIDGRPIRRMERGTGFGEVALLGDVPRTATVTADTDGLLIAVDRPRFLVTVTGDDSSRQASGLIRSLRSDAAPDDEPER